MTSSLTWKPVHKASGSLSDDLKRSIKLRDKWNDSNLIDVIYTHKDIDFLKGLKIGGVDGACSLIKLIEEHDEVHLMETYE